MRITWSQQWFTYCYCKMQLLVLEDSELQILIYQSDPLTAVGILPPHLETQIKGKLNASLRSLSLMVKDSMQYSGVASYAHLTYVNSTIWAIYLCVYKSCRVFQFLIPPNRIFLGKRKTNHWNVQEEWWVFRFPDFLFSVFHSSVAPFFT